MSPESMSRWAAACIQPPGLCITLTACLLVGGPSLRRLRLINLSSSEKCNSKNVLGGGFLVLRYVQLSIHREVRYGRVKHALNPTCRHWYRQNTRNCRRPRSTCVKNDFLLCASFGALQILVSWLHQRWVWHSSTAFAASSHLVYYEESQVCMKRHVVVRPRQLLYLSEGKRNTNECCSTSHLSGFTPVNLEAYDRL